MIDDHFLIIELAQSWVDNVNVNDWLPQLSKNATPPGFSFFYTGIHYLLFSLMEKTGIYDPQTKMYIVRIVHAFYSLLTIYFGYRITEKLTNIRYAKQVGLLLALFWLWPFLSVRNLIEVVCIPMLMWATWLAVKKENGNFLYYIAVGAVLGLVAFLSGADRGEVLEGFRGFGLLDRLDEPGDAEGGQNADDHDHNGQLNEGEPGAATARGIGQGLHGNFLGS